MKKYISHYSIVSTPDHTTDHYRATTDHYRALYPLSSLPHQITVHYEDEVVEGCPVRVRVLPDVSKAMAKGGLEPCALGSIVEVLVSSARGITWCAWWHVVRVASRGARGGT